MEILKQLETDFNQAFKARNELEILVLRQIKTSVTNAEIAKKREKLTEEEIIKLFRSEIKKRKEAAELYRRGGRPELAEKEEKEIGIIGRYLPPELSEEDIRKKVIEVIQKTNAQSIQEMGRVIGLVIKELASQADGNKVSQLVKEELTKK